MQKRDLDRHLSERCDSPNTILPYMTSTRTIRRSLLALLIAVVATATIGIAHAEEVKIAVVNMQQVLNRYDQTNVEVEALNEQARKLAEKSDAEKARFKQLTDRMIALQKTAADTILDEKKRKEAAEDFEIKNGERNDLMRKIQDAEGEAQEAFAKAKSKMEMRLVSVIDKMIKTIAEEKQIDIVWDSSFLPKANKAIKYTSSRVTDLTEEIVKRLND